MVALNDADEVPVDRLHDGLSACTHLMPPK
jgi:hypothetical protein